MNRKLWTSGYTLLNVMYFAAFCTVHAYAAVFLLYRGFTNTQIGVVLAVANISSALFQPVIAGVIDKGGWLTNRRFILISCLIILAGCVSLRFVSASFSFIFIVFAIVYMIQFAYQPVLTALCFEYQKKGCDINYGLSRGLGSAGFAVTSAFVGRAVEKKGAPLLMSVTVVIMIISIIAIWFYRPSDDRVSSGPDDKHEEAAGPSKTITGFFAAYPAFGLFAVATILFFFSHNMINDFLIQIVRSCGGSETELGYANFLQAILELPVMAASGYILKKVSPSRLLVFSGVAFFVKILILVFADSLLWVFVSQSFQLFAYAVFIPASAYYVSTVMADDDQVKGQAYFTSAITIGGVFSNLVSGVILDRLGIKHMLVTGSAVCLLGVLAAFAAFGLFGKKKVAADEA